MVNVCVLAALCDLYYCYFIQNTQNLPDHVSYTVEFNLSSAILRGVGSCCRAEHLHASRATAGEPCASGMESRGSMKSLLFSCKDLFCYFALV